MTYNKISLTILINPINMKHYFKTLIFVLCLEAEFLVPENRNNCIDLSSNSQCVTGEVMSSRLCRSVSTEGHGLPVIMSMYQKRMENGIYIYFYFKKGNEVLFF